MSIQRVLVSLKISSFHLELTSKNAVLMFSAPKPVGKHEFSDILNAQGFKSATGQDTGPQTLKSLKKEKNKSDDPIKAKVIFSRKISRALIGLFSSSIRGRNLKLEIMQVDGLIRDVT